MEYVAIIGDIIKSKEMESRKEVQERLYDVLNQINKWYEEEISAGFIITLGDEFQGLLHSIGHVLDIIKFIQREMYPVKIRFGIGIGKISTNIFRKAAIGADGPAYYAARMMVEELREQERKLKKQASDIMISIYQKECFQISEINIIFALIKIIENGWTEKQRFTIWDMEQNGGSQEECARRMNTTQSTVARRLAEGNYITYERAKETLEEALQNLRVAVYDE